MDDGRNRYEFTNPALIPLQLTLARLVQAEIDSTSINVSRHNISSNNLQDRIKIVTTNSDGPILLPLSEYVHFTPSFQSIQSSMRRWDRAGLDTGEFEYDFTMCNPPFYNSQSEIQKSAEGKEFGPNAVRVTFIIVLPHKAELDFDLW